MVDLLQVLEGATYLAFIAGAIFAVMELRSMGKDRETEFLMSMNDTWSSKDLQDVLIKVRELPESADAREIESKCGKLALHCYVEYLDGFAMLAENKALKLDFILGLAEWFSLWEKLEPWILEERQLGMKGFASGFEWLVEEDQKWFVRNLPKSEPSS